MLKGKERRFEVNMHYTLFPFTLPYYLLYPIDYSEHSDAALIDVMAGCGVDDVHWFYCRKLMRETHKHGDRDNAVHVAFTDQPFSPLS